MRYLLIRQRRQINMNFKAVVDNKIIYTPVETAVADLAAGKAIIVVDNEDRENEGDIVIAAEHITSEMIMLMGKKAGGMICLALEHDKVKKLELDLQPQRHLNENQARFTVSIEAREGVTTGISAPDRVTTVKEALKDNAGPETISTPGHVFPLMAHEKGLEGRQGHTEASIELARLAGCRPAAVICEILRDDGEMARGKELQDFADTHNMKIARIDHLIEYLREKL